MESNKRIFAEIAKLEAALLEASLKIRDISSVDSMAAWLTTVLEADPTLSRLVHLPTETYVRDALLVLLKSSSDLKSPIVTLLAQRIAAFIATIGDVAKHPLRGPSLGDLNANVASLNQLLDAYQLNYQHQKSVAAIAEAIGNHRLHVYKTFPKEPDLRVALRAFYEDDRRDDVAAVQRIWDFILKQLKEEVSHPGHISQPRHAWWALFSLCREGDPKWLPPHSRALNDIVRHLLNKAEYAPQKDIDYTSVAPELHSPDNEAIWLAINAMGMLASPAASCLSAPNFEHIKARIETIVSQQLQPRPSSPNLKLLQSRLLLMYEAVKYNGLLYSLETAAAKHIDVSKALVGQFYYDDTVVAACRPILQSAAKFIHNPKEWKRPTSTSMLVSGLAGQGKTELAMQVSKEIGRLAQAKGLAFRELNFAIGRDINDTADLKRCIEHVHADDKQEVQCVIFDEFDKAKADLNFCAAFLTTLEQAATGPVTFWFFAQSTYPTFADIKRAADGMANKALRDFLTRMQLGQIDVPHVRFYPQQKLFTALGMAKAALGPFESVNLDIIIEIVQRPDIANNRDVRSFVDKDIVLDGKVLALRNPANFSVGNYPEFRRKAKSEVPVLL